MHTASRSRPQSHPGDRHKSILGPRLPANSGGSGSSLLSLITDFLFPSEVSQVCSLKTPAGGEARNVLVNINPKQDGLKTGCFPGLAGVWTVAGILYPQVLECTVVLNMQRVCTFRTCSCFWELVERITGSESAEQNVGTGETWILRSFPGGREHYSQKLQEGGCAKALPKEPGCPVWRAGSLCCSGLLFGQSEVPGSLLCTFPHGLHQAGEAHVFGLLQAPHQPLLHDRNKFLIAQLSIAWKKRQRQVSEGLGTKMRKFHCHISSKV